jgi:hypothetical protein
MPHRLRTLGLVALVSLSSLFVGLSASYAQDGIMGQIQFVGASKAVKTSGVWIDGQYVGYLGELKGPQRIRLLPGEHEITVRQAGYGDFRQKAILEPGKILDVHVVMAKDPRFQYPDAKTSSEVRLDVRPERAAVFLDDNFVGHVQEFYGVGRAMLVTPGKHRIKIDLGGYKTFETEVNLLPRQKFTLKTELLEGSINDADPLIRGDRPVPLRANSSPIESSDKAK